LARALLVGCGCRGRALAAALGEDGWAVRGTSRTEAGLEAIRAAGIEPALADPDRLGTITDLIGDVTVLAWLMGSAEGEAGETANGPRLESLLERLVDTPVRGFVFEAAGTAPAAALATGAAMAEAASERWRIPVRILRAEPAEHRAWVEQARAAVSSVLS
jgi:nucleoside-diphosphate-sugar epimerase